ncbi:MAG: bifunctional oligoribonuclease/PAP phosphatase NrnA [Firmicutes bacterium]|nr:bifunctional oligoribonuclease/PAP phosphatase NrnA [Bacillota bacterium]
MDEIKDVKTNFKNAFALMSEARAIAITMHVRPDGDSVGSALAIQEILFGMGKKRVDVFVDGVAPQNFDYLKGYTGIIDVNTIDFEASPESPNSLGIKKYDLFIIVDTGDEPRLGACSRLRTVAKKVLVIDHHLNPTMEATTLVSNPTRGSVGEMVYELLVANKIEITQSIAESLYTAISSDTGRFLFPNTSPYTHQAAANLLKVGINSVAINYNNFQVYDSDKLSCFLKVLRRIKFHDDGVIASIHLNYRLVKKYGFSQDERHKMQGYATDARGVRVSIFMTEKERNVFNVSLRSHGDTNVAAIAKHFGGGGHKNAAGLVAYGKYKVLIKRILRKVREMVKEQKHLTVH